jgi:hypothetical protein
MTLSDRCDTCMKKNGWTKCELPPFCQAECIRHFIEAKEKK